METDVTRVATASGGAKVSNSMCTELTKLLDTVCSVLPAIESAKPGHTFGIQQLCALNNSIDKARLLLQHCTESSKLYLAITSEATLLRCERIKNSFIQSFFHVQNMVPQFLIFKIEEILEYLKAVKFSIDCAEKEAGRALLALLQQTDSSEAFEFEAFQFAASKLELTTPKAILIEKRSVKKLLDKFKSSEAKERKILEYFLYLLQKHANNFGKEHIQIKENETTYNKRLASQTTHTYNGNIHDKNRRNSGLGKAVTDDSETIKLSEELYYPISLGSMDSVITSSTSTKDCGSNFYLKNNVETAEARHELSYEDSYSREYLHSDSMSSLENFYSALWDGKSGDDFLHSNISFIWCDVRYNSDSLQFNEIKKPKDDNGHLFCWREDCKACQSFSTSSSDKYTRFLYSLLELPIDARNKAIEDQKKHLQREMENCNTKHYYFLQALILFLKNAHDLADVQAQKTGIQLFLVFLSNNRSEISSLPEDVFDVLISLLNSETVVETLMILQKLVQHKSCGSMSMRSDLISSILKLLDLDNLDILEPSLKLLVELSTHEDVKLQIISTGCITKLNSFLTHERLEESCLRLLRNICDVEEGASLITMVTDFLPRIAELLENGSDAKRLQAVAVLYSICSKSLENTLLVLAEGVIPALVEICATGNEGKEISSKLLHLLRDASHGYGSTI